MSRLPSLLDRSEAVRARLATGRPALVALDFDGTLTEIVDDPAAPRLTSGRREILSRLPSPRRALAIVSGRALEDVRERVGLDEAIYVGNHGIEIEGPGIEGSQDEAGVIARRLSSLLDALPEIDGVFVEDKRLSATVHVRPRSDEARHRAVAEALGGAARDAGFVLRPGKASWEIRPVEARDKGEALERLIDHVPGARVETSMYIGDDATDEDAFRALAGGITARVGSAEAATAADAHVPDPDAVYRLLEAIADDDLAKRSGTLA